MAARPEAAARPRSTGSRTSSSSTPRTTASTTCTGCFPGRTASRNATAEQKTQLDHDGKPLPHLPSTYNAGKLEPRYPTRGLPNGPFRIDAPPIDARMDQVVPSPIHNYWQNIEQINGGKNNMFVAMTTVGAWTMGYYDGSSMRMWQWAKRYVLADNFFMGAFGGSYLNHHWLVCACTPRVPQCACGAAPSARRARNAQEASRLPCICHGRSAAPLRRHGHAGRLQRQHLAAALPAERHAAGGRWQSRAGRSRRAIPCRRRRRRRSATRCPQRASRGPGTPAPGTQALADGTRDPKEKRAIIYNREAGSPNFQPHHQPFNYYARFAPGTPDRERHLKDGEDFLAAIDRGQLPQVAFYKPAGRLTQHPSYTDIQSGDHPHLGAARAAARRARSGRTCWSS